MRSAGFLALDTYLSRSTSATPRATRRARRGAVSATSRSRAFKTAPRSHPAAILYWCAKNRPANATPRATAITAN